MVSIMVSIMASIMASIMVTAKAMKGRASGASLRYAPSPSQRKPRGNSRTKVRLGWCALGLNWRGIASGIGGKG